MPYIILFFASFVDFCTTSWLIYKQGIDIELNPFLNYMMHYLNQPYIVLALAKFLPFIILIIFFKLNKLKLSKGVQTFLWVVTIFQAMIACYGSYIVIQS